MFRAAVGRWGRTNLRFPQRMPHRCLSTVPQAADIPLSKDRYGVARGQYATLQDTDVAHFRSILPEANRILEGLDETAGYNRDYFRSVRGLGGLVLKPRTPQEVAAILRHCNGRRLAVSVYGGNTGVCGGSIPVHDEVILSLELMNRILGIDEYAGTLRCEAGCVLEQVEGKLSERGMIMPLDLGSKASCQIGGNLATNAGGIRLVRYGNLHGTVLGVEVVTADGRILDMMSGLKKDNTGYHLKHLFIGSEGTLGVITKVAIACPAASTAHSVMFLGVESYDKVMATFLAAKRNLGEILSSCELIDSDSLDCCTGRFNLQAPIGKHPFYLLIETAGSNAAHDEEKMNAFLSRAMDDGQVSDGTVTNEPSKMKRIWELRERIPDGAYSHRFCFTYDFSLPLKNFYDIVPVMRERVGSQVDLVCGFGHIGDSNLHLNIAGTDLTPELHGLIEPFVYEYTAKLRGSVSAEHGIGLLKTKYLKYSKAPETVELMKQLKLLMDPNGILNPYKVLHS